MAEKKRNLVVQWRDDGDWFQGRKAGDFRIWTRKQSRARRFADQAEFRAYEKKTRGVWLCAWTRDQIRFVRLVPRKVSP